MTSHGNRNIWTMSATTMVTMILLKTRANSPSHQIPKGERFTNI